MASETQTLIEVFTKLLNAFRASNDKSYADIVGDTRVSPLCIVSNDLRNYEHTTLIMQSSLNVVVAYYMQALPLVANVGGVNVKEILGRLGSGGSSGDLRGLGLNSYQETRPALEAHIPIMGLPNNAFIRDIKKYVHLAPSFEDEISDLHREIDDLERKLDTNSEEMARGGAANSDHAKLARERTDYKNRIATKQSKVQRLESAKRSKLDKRNRKQSKVDRKRNDKRHRQQQSDRKQTAKERKAQKREEAITKRRVSARSGVQEDLKASNLMVGKIIEVELESANGTIKVPVTATLSSKFVTPRIASLVLSSENLDGSAREGLFRVSSGLRSVKDFIMADTLIEKRKHDLINDDEGILREIQRRRGKGMVRVAMSQKSQVGVDNNVVIISTTVLRQVEKAVRGRLSTGSRVRRDLFKSSGAMVIVIVDQEDDFLSIWYKDLPSPTEVSMRALKSSKDAGPDIGDILKSLTQNSTPII
jgi:hypothetical protein